MKLLITGFNPFGGETINPAWEAVKNLPNQIDKVTIIKLEIPTVFHQSAEVVKKAILKHQPDIVLNIGQAGGRHCVTPERVAINIDDARIPDNIGNQPIDQKIQPTGDAAYFSQLPVKAMVQKIKEAGLPSSLSNSAGTFVCNHIMYQVQYLIATEFPALKGGFIHVPFIPAQIVDKPQYPSMSLEDITQSLLVAIKAIIAFDQQADLKTVEGTTH